jgi:hypothetical protein
MEGESEIEIRQVVEMEDFPDVTPEMLAQEERMRVEVAEQQKK